MNTMNKQSHSAPSKRTRVRAYAAWLSVRTMTKKHFTTLSMRLIYATSRLTMARVRIAFPPRAGDKKIICMCMDQMAAA